MGFTAEDLLSSTRARTSTVAVCVDSNLMAEYNDALSDLRKSQATSKSGMMMPEEDGGDHELVARVKELGKKVNDATYEIKLQEVAPGRKYEIRNRNTLSSAEAKKRNLQQGSVDSDAMMVELCYESAVEPEFTKEQMEEFLNSSESIRSRMFKAVDDLHKARSEDPKERLATARRLVSEAK